MHNKIPELPEFSPHNDWRIFEPAPTCALNTRLPIGAEFLIERVRPGEPGRYKITVKNVHEQPFAGIVLTVFNDFDSKKACFPHWMSGADVFSRALLSESVVFGLGDHLCVTVEYGIVDRVVTIGLVNISKSGKKLQYAKRADGSAHGNNY